MSVAPIFEDGPWARLLRALVGIMSAVLVVVIALAIVGEHWRADHLVEHQGELLAASVVGSMSESLATGRNEEVIELFAGLKESAPDVDVYVFDPRAEVSFATERGDIGRSMSELSSDREVATVVKRVLAGEQLANSAVREEIDGQPWLSVVQPIHNAARCHDCHGSSSAILGGIMVRSSAARSAQAIRTARNVNIVVGLIGLVVAVLLMQFLLQKVVRDLLADVVSGGEVMASSSSELFGVFQNLSADSVDTSARSQAVASSARDLSSTMDTIASAMEQTSASANTIAIATEEMTASVAEIAREAASASTVTREAVNEASSASQLIIELGRQVGEIGAVTELISKISEQINLLALNATIESARAGDAGKGFAVVANEVKHLAGDTAEATEAIREKIDGIQNFTTRIVAEVEKFSDVVSRVNSIVTSIAAAVEEQAATTSQISSSVAQSSSGVQQVTEEVARVSTGLDNIANDMSEVNALASKVSDWSTTVNHRAEELSGLAARMKELIARFRM